MPHNLKKIISASQFAETDKHTIESLPIASIDLMEQAANRFVNAIDTTHFKGKKIAVVCGSGNNGGDGFVVSRLLLNQRYSVDTFLVKFTDKLSPDCATNREKVKVVVDIDADSIPNFSEYDVIIDALFGVGINRPITGIAAKVVEAINHSNAEVISVDMPSGFQCNKIADSDAVVQSDLTITFQRPKFSFFLPENGKYLSQWKSVNIGLDEDFIQQLDSSSFVLDQRIASAVIARPKFSHKGTYGHALLVAGSHGKMGAAILSSRATLAAGAGLISTHVPNCGYEIMQTSVPEAMCLADENEDFITQIPSLDSFSAIGAGPGLGTETETALALEQLLKRCKKPLVIDADGLNIISKNNDFLGLLTKNTILTPHIKEFDRMVGASKNSIERIEKQRAFSRKHECIVVLKDAHTCISDTQGNVYFNTSGNPGMATGGSGDVLTGVILGLLAQHYSSLDAALIAVYFHGLAGDDAAKQKGEAAIIASDIIEHLCIKAG